MNVQTMNATVSQDQARAAMLEYKGHRDKYDKRDWEIERIYRHIALGKKVISVADAIRLAGFDAQNRPLLAIARADDLLCRCKVDTDRVTFAAPGCKRSFQIDWPGVRYTPKSYSIQAAVPRIPPQYRPAPSQLRKYHILWEADWLAIPRDPYLLRRIGKDAWIVLAAWDLTDVEISVLRAHQGRQ